MCGVIGIHSTTATEKITYEVFEGLMALQHRGQDSVGISNDNCTIKRSGLVKYAFKNDDLSKLKGQVCIGHVRYATNGVSDNIQPLYSWFPVRTTLCHNGNITNTEEIKNLLKRKIKMMTEEKNEALLELFAELVVYLNLEEMIEHWIDEETVDLSKDEFRNFLKHKRITLH